MNDFSFIIQGPYNTAHLTMIHDLKKEGKVILSCYVSDYNKVTNPEQYDFIIFNEQVDVEKKNIYNLHNVYHQVRTTKNALSIVDTEYAVKLRSDSYYSGIDSIIESIKNNPNKLSVSPNFINPDWPYHLSDHIMGSTSANLKNTFFEAENIILTKKFFYEGIDVQLCPEVLLFTSWLKAKGFKSGTFAFEFYIKGDPQTDVRMKYTNGEIKVWVYKDYCSTIRDNINILDISKMEPFFVNSNTQNKCFNKAIDFPIRDMETYISEIHKRYSSFELDP